MERGEHSPGTHAGTAADQVIAADGEKALSVLVPPRPTAAPAGPRS